MATFTIDLLTGNVYLFNGDFTGSGTTSSGSTYPEVNLYSELPSAGSHSGEIYVVRSGSGNYILNRKEGGLYFSNGLQWRRLGDIPSFFKSDNFQIYDDGDITKGVTFETSGVSTNVFRKLEVQDQDGTIALLADLNTKVDTSAFADYTGTTAPNTYVNQSNFDTYSGNTLSLIGTKQDQLTAGDNISISSNVISVTGITKNAALQLIDETGSQQVNNITVTPIQWTTEVFSGDSLNYTGGSRIYIQDTGIYDLSYVLNLNNDTGSNKNIGSVIRKNNNKDITPMSFASVNLDFENNSSTNSIPNYSVNLNSGDYIELVAFRIGFSGDVYTRENGSWIKIQKKNNN
jgi:hypothetical protein